jgi:S-formylglutathione hydrolase FrmB
MAFLQVQFFSKALGLCCGANVILPQAKGRAQGKEIPVVYLLHGHSDDNTIWMRRTSVERYAEELAPEFAVVMPAVDKSFYADMKHGGKYWSYVSLELPEIMASMFPLSQMREDTFAAGLSMGGYGALKLALNHPERFLTCASFSGACDMGTRLAGVSPDDEFNRAMMDIFGTEQDFLHSENDLRWQAEQAAKGKFIPKIYMSCGTKDFLYDSNLAFLGHLKSLNLPVQWVATPGREHTWDYWDEQIQAALKWFAELRKEAKEG